MTDARLQQAVELSEQGQDTEARTLVSAYLREHPTDAEAWGIMSQIVEDKVQAIDCLERSLKYAQDDFTRDWAEDQLAVLRGTQFVPQTGPLSALEDEDDEAPAPAPSTPPAATDDDDEPQPDFDMLFGSEPGTPDWDKDGDGIDDILQGLGAGSGSAALSDEAREDTGTFLSEDDFLASLGLGGEKPASQEDLLAGLGIDDDEDDDVQPVSGADFLAGLGLSADEGDESDVQPPASADLLAGLGFDTDDESRESKEEYAEAQNLDELFAGLIERGEDNEAEPAQPSGGAADTVFSMGWQESPQPPQAEKSATGIPSSFGRGTDDFFASLGISAGDADEPPIGRADDLLGDLGSFSEPTPEPEPEEQASAEAAAEAGDIPGFDWLTSTPDEDADQVDIFAGLGLDEPTPPSELEPEPETAPEPEPVISELEEEADFLASLGVSSEEPTSTIDDLFDSYSAVSEAEPAWIDRQEGGPETERIGEPAAEVEATAVGLPTAAVPAAAAGASAEGRDDAALLKRAVALAKQGDRTQAGQLVDRVLDADPNNAEAWAVMSQLVTDPELEIRCLENVIRLSEEEKVQRWAAERLIRIETQVVQKKKGRGRGCLLVIMLLFAGLILGAAGLVYVVRSNPGLLPFNIPGLSAPAPQATPTLLSLPTAAPTEEPTATLEPTEPTPTVAPTATPLPTPEPVSGIQQIVGGAFDVVAWAPSGTSLAAAGADGLAVYDTGGLVLLAPENTGASALAYSPDGTLLASGDEAGGVTVWDVPTGTPIASIPYGDSVFALAFSPDGTQLAVGGYTGLIGLYDPATGESLLEINPESGDPVDLTYSPDGQTLAVAMQFPSLFGSILVFDVASGAQLATFDREYTISALDYTPDSAAIVYGMKNGEVGIWMLPVNGEGGISPDAVGATATPTAIIATPTAIATAEATQEPADDLILLIEPTTITDELIAEGQENWPFLVADVAFDREETLAVLLQDGTLLLFEGLTPDEIDLGAVVPNDIDWNPAGDTLAVASDAGLLLVNPSLVLGGAAPLEGAGGGGESAGAALPDTFAGAALDVVGAVADTGAMPFDLAFTREGAGLMAALGESVTTYDLSDLTLITIGREVAAPLEIASATQLDAGGGMVSGAVTLGERAVWENVNGAEPFLLLAAADDGESISVLAFGPADSTLIAYSSDQSVIVYDYAADAVVMQASGHPDVVAALAWSADGARLASGSQDGTVVIWDVATAEPLGIYGPRPENPAITGLAFSPDGSLLAVIETYVDGSSNLTILNGQDGDPLGLSAAEPVALLDLVYVAGGTQLLAMDSTGTLTLRDAADLSPLAVAELPGDTPAGAVSLAVSPDETLAAVGLDDERILLFALIDAE